MPNKRSQYIIQVNDKIFKLRKNPAYTGILDLPELPVEDDEANNKSNEDDDDLDLNDDMGKHTNDGDVGVVLSSTDQTNDASDHAAV